MLRSGQIRKRFGWLDFSDGLDVGGEKKERFKGNSQVWG